MIFPKKISGGHLKNLSLALKNLSWPPRYLSRQRPLPVTPPVTPPLSLLCSAIQGGRLQLKGVTRRLARVARASRTAQR